MAALTPEHRAKLSAAKRGKKRAALTPEHRAKISASMRGKKQSPEHIAALSLVRKGKSTPAMRAALERARSGYNEESRKKQSKTMSEKMKGAPRSEAQKKAFDEARKKAHSAILRGEAPPRTPKFGLYATMGSQLRERDGDLCQLCLKRIDFDIPARDPMSRSVDHINPRSNGGSDDPNNLWLTHLVCNQRKGSRYVGRQNGSTDIRRHSGADQTISKEGTTWKL